MSKNSSSCDNNKLYKSQKDITPNPNETINIWDMKSKDQFLKPKVENDIIKLQEEKIRKNLKACREKHRKEMKRNKNIILNDKENNNVMQSTKPDIQETDSKSFEIEIKPKIDQNNSIIKYPIKRKYCELETSFPNLKRMSFIEKAATINIDEYFQEKSKNNENKEESKFDKIIFEEKSIEIQSIYSSQSVEPVTKKPYLNNSTSFKNPNENYVKLNKKFKCFSRKGSAKQKSVQNSIHRAKWNKARGFGKCFRCGEEGHYANNCPIRAKYGPSDEKSNKNVLGFTDMCDSVKISDFRLQNLDKLNNIKETKRLNFQSYTDNKEKKQEQMRHLNENSDDMEECLKKSLKIFGFSSFRKYQEKIIRRISAGKSTIAVLPTGSGKSLCYQIPAYIYQQTKQSIALIVSPLISLMQDQLVKLPKEIKGIALNSTLKYEEKMKVLKEINDLQYAFVLLSPEALVESNWLTPDKLTAKISFACIDEVHCLSDWSHHFRPSYLRVCKILRDKYRVNCFLGLSATCTSNTIDNIGKLLKIDRVSDPESCIKHTPIPENITISVIEVKNKEKSLLELLQKPPFSVSSSILIYCASREETVYLSSLIRDNLQSDNDETIITTTTTVNNKQKQQKTKKKLTWTTQAYHAGLSLSDRSKYQKMFMRGRTRVLVATVAFGMGLDKPDIRAVIHYSRPRSFENYVQEIGRAGRDSLPSHALVMIYKDELKQQEIEELNELHRHTFGNHVELIVLKRFIKLIFTELLLEGNKKCVNRVCGHCQGHIVGFSPSEIAEKLNIREETLMTLLCYIELYEEMEILKILPANYRYARTSCYRGPQQLAELSQKSLPISINITNQYFNRTIDLINNCRSVEFDMIDMWEKYDIDVSIIRKELKSFEWNQTEDKEGNIRYSNTGISNDFTQWNWILSVRCDIDENSLDKLVDHLYSRLKDLENKTVDDVEILYNLLKNNRITEFSKLYSQEYDQELVKKSTEIRNAIIQYFDEKGEKILLKKELNKTYSRPIELEVRCHIRAFVAQYKSDNSMTGRSIASVFHGINCPNFPSLFWSGQKTFWKSTLNIDFITLMNWANEELRYLL